MMKAAPANEGDIRDPNQKERTVKVRIIVFVFLFIYFFLKEEEEKKSLVSK